MKLTSSLPLALGAIGLALAPTAQCLQPSDLPADTPVSVLLSSATVSLASGNGQDALVYYDLAVSREPSNYLTLFKRGAAHLSLGKHAQARQDFDKVLMIRPGFEGALVQRARIRSKIADWEGAKSDFQAAGKHEEIAELEQAEGSSRLALESERGGNWDDCIAQAGIAIGTAALAVDLRQIRARCRFATGDLLGGVSDLGHALQINPSATKPHLQISAIMFYSLGETDKGLEQSTKCLHSDPESKECMKLRRHEKSMDKQLKKVRQFMEKRQYASAVKIMVPSGEDSGLLQEVKDDTKTYEDQGIIPKNAAHGLANLLTELTCEAYYEMNNLKKAAPHCTETLGHNPDSLHALLHKAQTQLDNDDFEPAMHTLNQAREHHPRNQKINEMFQKAHGLLKRSKQKDYYKVLGLGRDADERDIKSAYRRLVRLHHPDKAQLQGLTKEEAEKKMAAINEAYEVLSDAELKARYDRGDDPNDPQQQSHPFQSSPFGHGGPGGGQQFFFRQGPMGGGGGGGGGYKFGGGGQGGFQFPGGFGFP